VNGVRRSLFLTEKTKDFVKNLVKKKGLVKEELAKKKDMLYAEGGWVSS